ncbi:hypothetical protein ACNRBV_22725 [Ralstonia pseudosolanacearum]|uniref:hypothetical protein n=1 Tax=Ralstonia pseudosolanacearum TaxID=1310165 RepID=UPI0018A38F7F|nr:hypothetical protein [Ralstonia pseudosolanacearum]BCL90913.1 hypothetical protein MAFF211479_06140 [Ralstonia solanacearum]BCN03477.1 hypothetical protein RPSB_06140 [Ralstonia solanacearum]
MDSMWFPRGEMIRYACMKCGSTLPSIGDRMLACACGNVRIQDGRIALEDAAQFLAVVEAAQSMLVRPMLLAWSAGMPVRDLQTMVPRAWKSAFNRIYSDPAMRERGSATKNTAQ